MQQYKVTIGVRCYNAEKYIERCARSLFEQTYNNCDFLFVDDCSNDNTLQILKAIASKYPNRESQLRIVKRQENGNRACCMNTVLDNIQGEFFTLVDSDDYLELNAIEEFYHAQVSSKADMVLCEMKNLWADRTTEIGINDYSSGKELCLAQLGHKARWCVCGSFIRTSLLSPDIRCLPGANMGEDFAVEVRLSDKARKVQIIHKSLYVYDRTNENASMFSFNESFLRQFDDNMDLLYKIFSNRGEEYIDAWNHTRVKSLIEDVKLVCRAGGHDVFYRDRVRRIRNIEKKHKRFYPFSYKFIDSFLWFRPLLNLLLR